MAVADTAECEELRAQLQEEIFQFLMRSEGFTPEVEIRNFRRIEASPGATACQGELFLSFRRFTDDANHEDLRAAATRLSDGFASGSVSERVRSAEVGDSLVGIFNEDNGARVTLELV